MTPKSILLAVLGVSTVGGVVTGCYFFMKPSNIGELLISENVKLLNENGHDEEWKKLIAKHNGQELTITTNDNKKVTIKAITDLNNISTQNTENMTKLKQKCKELLGKAITKGTEFETNKQAAKDWCSLDSAIFKEKDQSATARDTLTTSSSNDVSLSGGSRSTSDLGKSDQTQNRDGG